MVSDKMAPILLACHTTSVVPTTVVRGKNSRSMQTLRWRIDQSGTVDVALVDTPFMSLWAFKDLSR